MNIYLGYCFLFVESFYVLFDKMELNGNFRKYFVSKKIDCCLFIFHFMSKNLFASIWPS